MLTASYCSAKREISSYKVPKTIHFVNQLPVSATGKILKGKLKALFSVVLPE